MCVQGPVAEARAHRKKRDVSAARPCGQGRCETTKIEIHKTNLECALESTVSLFGALTSPCRLGARVGWSLPGGKPRGGGANQAEVDNKGLKRTGRAISFAFNIIRAIRANELQGVKSFVMYGMSGDLLETFIPAYSRLTSTSVGLYSERVRKNLTPLLRSCPGHTISAVLTSNQGGPGAYFSEFLKRCWLNIQPPPLKKAAPLCRLYFDFTWH